MTTTATTRRPAPGSHGRLTKPRPKGDFYRSPPHAVALLPEGGEPHALMRHASMTAEGRAYLLPSLKRIVMCGRLNMLPHDREHDDKGHETHSDFSWFTFTKGRTAGTTSIMHALDRS